MKILIKGGRVMDPAGGFDQRCDLALADAKIVAIKDIGADFHPDRVIDASRCVVAPSQRRFIFRSLVFTN